MIKKYKGVCNRYNVYISKETHLEMIKKGTYKVPPSFYDEMGSYELMFDTKKKNYSAYRVIQGGINECITFEHKLSSDGINELKKEIKNGHLIEIN